VSQDGVPGAFGGGLLGQSITAAAATVPAPFQVYSIQASFLRPANGKGEISYAVTRVADRRAFATRLVRATSVDGAGDEPIYIAVVSFQKNDLPASNVLTYGTPAPNVGVRHPEDISEERIQVMMSAAVTRDVPLLQLSAQEEPFDWRPLENALTEDPTHFRQRSFVRSPTLTSDSPSVHLAALAYLSDTYLLGAPLGANPVMVGPKLRNVAMGTSLHHNLSLLDPTARVDKWMLGERETSWGADGRVLIHQRFWNATTGRLVMSGTQEGLIRLKQAQL
jgi:acyl-CoA thioesterase II